MRRRAVPLGRRMDVPKENFSTYHYSELLEPGEYNEVEYFNFQPFEESPYQVELFLSEKSVEVEFNTDKDWSTLLETVNNYFPLRQKSQIWFKSKGKDYSDDWSDLRRADDIEDFNIFYTSSAQEFDAGWDSRDIQSFANTSRFTLTLWSPTGFQIDAVSFEALDKLAPEMMPEDLPTEKASDLLSDISVFLDNKYRDRGRPMAYEFNNDVWNEYWSQKLQ